MKKIERAALLIEEWRVSLQALRRQFKQALEREAHKKLFPEARENGIRYAAVMKWCRTVKEEASKNDTRR